MKFNQREYSLIIMLLRREKYRLEKVLDNMRIESATLGEMNASQPNSIAAVEHRINEMQELLDRFFNEGGV